MRKRESAHSAARSLFFARRAGRAAQCRALSLISHLTCSLPPPRPPTRHHHHEAEGDRWARLGVAGRTCESVGRAIGGARRGRVKDGCSENQKTTISWISFPFGLHARTHTLSHTHRQARTLAHTPLVRGLAASTVVPSAVPPLSCSPCSPCRHGPTAARRAMQHDAWQTACNMQHDVLLGSSTPAATQR